MNATMRGLADAELARAIDGLLADRDWLLSECAFLAGHDVPAATRATLRLRLGRADTGLERLQTEARRRDLDPLGARRGRW